ncbi:hypothetical protein PNOK_0637200 [Pyrrhoderma noxium]|uniref:Uncharacterized protein n=1 Tax=Pyrrhoderma noxium TaxID=2282107 RepID=A0A286UE60_9AGAM|nr:hypothetical protein PNOK_0637200 [Pyrrhoderma noxium]
MSNDLLSAEAGICGICCICCTASFWTFCDQKAYGSGSRLSAPCGGPRGCCGSCLEDSGEDSFEKAERKEKERREKQEAELRNGVAKDQSNPQGNNNATDVVSSQPLPSEQMATPKIQT